MLVRVIKNWSTPDLMRQTSGYSGSWEGIRFTCDPVDECDVIIVLNYVLDTVTVRCAPDNVWALMQEPYVRGVFDWIVEGHEQYRHVFTHHLKRRTERKRYIPCQPALPWHVNKSYDELKNIKVPAKLKAISWITSNIATFPGHKARMDFLAFLRSRALPIDLYGKGISYIEDKWDGLAPYRYSLAIENSSGPDYWTEKVADCFLSWTVPIYFGCINLEDYFPAESFIRIDISQPEAALKTISTALSSNNWETRLTALEEARNLVLERYQFFPQMKKLIEDQYTNTPKKNLVLQPYRKQEKIGRRICERLSRAMRKV